MLLAKMCSGVPFADDTIISSWETRHTPHRFQYEFCLNKAEIFWTK